MNGVFRFLLVVRARFRHMGLVHRGVETVAGSVTHHAAGLNEIPAVIAHHAQHGHLRTVGQHAKGVGLFVHGGRAQRNAVAACGVAHLKDRRFHLDIGPAFIHMTGKHVAFQRLRRRPVQLHFGKAVSFFHHADVHAAVHFGHHVALLAGFRIHLDADRFVAVIQDNCPHRLIIRNAVRQSGHAHHRHQQRHQQRYKAFHHHVSLLFTGESGVFSFFIRRGDRVETARALFFPGLPFLSSSDHMTLLESLFIPNFANCVFFYS